MNDNGVESVSLSISSKYYSDDLEEWISKHADTIEIYGSYNNLENSNDYPAMYECVHGVGSSNVCKKKNDVLYQTSNIIVLNKQICFFSGNSYLTPYTMIKRYEKVEKKEHSWN